MSETASLQLKLLDPLIDLDLFHVAFNWRPEPKKHVGANRVTFEQFSSTDPLQIVIGLFDPDLIAVFVYYETEPKVYDCHFTSKRNTPRQTLLDAAREINTCLLANGAERLTASIVERNKPLRRFVEDLEFTVQGKFTAPKRKEKTCDSVSCSQVFVEYAITRSVP